MDDKENNELPQRHRNCLLHECGFWVYHLLVIALACVNLAKIVAVNKLA